jgi:hypothetical protein
LTKAFKGNFSEESAYISLPLLCLLGFIWRQHRTLPAFQILGSVILLACLFSFGPYLHIFGVAVSTAPWLLAGDLPFLKAMLPARFMLYAWIAIALFLALWLATPGRKWPRYAGLALCLIFLAPARAFDRNWTQLAAPSMLTDGAIPAGSEILILPEAGAEMGMQYESGMKFSLAGQGYLGCGSPLPFAAWPLYRTLFVAKYARYLPLIDPRMLSAFLAAYHVQYVVVLNDFDAGYAPKQIVLLFNAAGWKLVRADADAKLLAPQSPSMPPDAMQIAAFMRMPPPERRPMQIRNEAEWVHAIRAVSRFTGMNPEPFLNAYASYAHPPLPIEAIGATGA